MSSGWPWCSVNKLEGELPAAGPDPVTEDAVERARAVARLFEPSGDRPDLTIAIVAGELARSQYKAEACYLNTNELQLHPVWKQSDMELVMSCLSKELESLSYMEPVRRKLHDGKSSTKNMPHVKLMNALLKEAEERIEMMLRLARGASTASSPVSETSEDSIKQTKARAAVGRRPR